MLQNKKELKLNLQLFAEPNKEDEKLDEEKKEEKLDLSGFVKKEDLTEFENRILQALKPKEEEKKEEEIKETLPGDMPEWAKVLYKKIEDTENSAKSTKEQILSEKKSKIAKEFGLEESDLNEIKDEITLNVFEKNLKNIVKKKEVEIEKELPEKLKKQGKIISDFNDINKKSEKVNNDLLKKGLAFMKS